MAFEAKNVMSKKFIMKLVELFFVFIVFLLFRVGQNGDAFYWGTGAAAISERAENDLIFGILTSVGYFYITIVLMVGIALGDRQKFTLLLFNSFGFLFYLSLGSEHISVNSDRPTDKPRANAMGAMAILTSFTFLVDSVFSVLDVMNED